MGGRGRWIQVHCRVQCRNRLIVLPNLVQGDAEVGIRLGVLWAFPNGLTKFLTGREQLPTSSQLDAGLVMTLCFIWASGCRSWEVRLTA